jgi:hypothetical protein
MKTVSLRRTKVLLAEPSPCVRRLVLDFDEHRSQVRVLLSDEPMEVFTCRQGENDEKNTITFDNESD